MPRHAVLDGISSAYPPVAGRVHTCYSPVRRSPAGDGKPSPPLPLDLHVLSLSLAFILSQDQTLRCCILFLFFLFRIKKRQDAFMLSIPSRTRMPHRHGTNRHHRPLSNRLAELTEIFPPPGQTRTARSLVLLRL